MKYIKVNLSRWILGIDLSLELNFAIVVVNSS